MNPLPETAVEHKAVGRSPRLSKSPETSAKDLEGNRKGGSKRGGLQEAKMIGRMARIKGEDKLTKRLKNLDMSQKASAEGTGLVYNEMFARPRCLWNPCHPESPERVSMIMEQVEKQRLLTGCVSLEARAASEEELLMVHTKEYVELMRSTQSMTESQLHSLSDNYDSVYIHPEVFLCASLAVGSVLQLVDKVLTSVLRNGFSVARPPGHHAQPGQSNGYCIFNNLAVAARYAQRKHGVERVLIVDWDVHHGQGIQYIFQDDPSVLYFSVHRYENGSFWPHLPESDSNAVGIGAGAGFNINLPWNKTGMRDGDYLAAFQQLLLPVAYEFQPELVLVAAGFDSVIGDPKGEMDVSPQCFAVLTHMLMGLAQGKLVMALEGGYNLQSTADGVIACLRALLGESCPTLISPVVPSPSALMSISQTISALYPYWTCLQLLEGGPLVDGNPLNIKPIHEAGNEARKLEVSHVYPNTMTTGLVYDQRMMEHLNMWDSHHPEQPQRISRIFSHLKDLGLVTRCEGIPARLATEEELSMCHGQKHISQIKSTENMKPRDLHRLGEEFNSIFINNQSYNSARLAAGACFNTAKHILSGQVRNGVAIVRPPGHHAEAETACGFCFFNTAALTARYAQSICNYPLRVLILDWDVHHGNGTQHIFEEDDSVLYISLHRYEDATFFPSSEDANYDRLGQNKGAGFNVNIPWSGGRMGDPEYLAAFHNIVMPIATEFNPGLVLVSAGFDAARGDPLGGYQVTPEGYAHLTHLLQRLAGGRVLVILEGGYNLSSISESMSMCTSMLLGDIPPPLLPLPPPHPSAARTINNVIRCHAPYWNSLKIQIPESLHLSLPPPAPRGKCSSKGLGRKSGSSTPRSTPVQRHTPVLPLPAKQESDITLDQLTDGLEALVINQTTSASPSTSSILVGGARQKVRSSPQQSSDEDGGKVEPEPVTTEVIAETELDLRSKTVSEVTSYHVAAEYQDVAVSVPEGACGWSKPQKPAFEIFYGDRDSKEETMYVVDPLSWCPHLGEVKPVPSGSIDVFQPCLECGTDAENWICLTCYEVYCGRYVNEHMVTHGVVSEHPMVLSFSDLSVWCYRCEAYVHNKILFDAKNAAHYIKFGEDMPVNK